MKRLTLPIWMLLLGCAATTTQPPLPPLAADQAPWLRTWTWMVWYQMCLADLGYYHAPITGLDSPAHVEALHAFYTHFTTHEIQGMGRDISRYEVRQEAIRLLAFTCKDRLGHPDQDFRPPIPPPCEVAAVEGCWRLDEGPPPIPPGHQPLQGTEEKHP